MDADHGKRAQVKKENLDAGIRQAQNRLVCLEKAVPRIVNYV